MNEQKSVPVRNPRYEGATPEMVGLALLKHKPPQPQSDKPDEEQQERKSTAR